MVVARGRVVVATSCSTVVVVADRTVVDGAYRTGSHTAPRAVASASTP